MCTVVLFVTEKKILAGHDISDGGLLTTVLEMCFAGLCGADINLTECSATDTINALFHEEVGWIIETELEVSDDVKLRFQSQGIKCEIIGQTVGYGPISKV